MFDAWGSPRRSRRVKYVNIDNAIFRLHYKFTTILLLAFCALVTCRQYFGKPIQWICYALFVQSLLFYIPHYLWQNLEGGRMKAFLAGISSQIGDKESREECSKRLSDQFFASQTQHNLYFFKLLFCEVLNFAVVIAQIITISIFVRGRFSYYYGGYEMYRDSSLANRIDPLTIAFPRVIGCMFNTFSPSGTVENYEVPCALHHNADNEKMYYFLWIWFIILAKLTALAILYRILSNVVSALRMPVLRLRARSVPPRVVNRFAHMASVGDWFFIQMLSKNLPPLIFNEFMVSVARHFEGDNLRDKNERAGSSLPMTSVVVTSSDPSDVNVMAS